MKKPFKLGARYRLRKSMTNKFQYNTYINDAFGITTGEVFEFTVDSFGGCTGQFIYPSEKPVLCVAMAMERDYFKRIDNK